MMSKQNYIEIKMILREMCKIEFGKSMSEMTKTEFYIDDENNKIIVKNYDDDITFDEIIPCYLDILDYNYLQYFQIGYTFNKFEIIEFEVNNL